MENEISGIILEAQERGRSSRYVKLLSSEGAVHLLIPKSASSAQWSDLTQPLHQVRYLIEESSKGLRFKEGVVDERFSGLRRQLSSIEVAQQMRLVALKMVKPGLPCPEFFQSFVIHLRALSSSVYSHITPRAILSSFLVKALWQEGLFNPWQQALCVCCMRQEAQMVLGKNMEWYCEKHGLHETHRSLNALERELICFLAQNRRLSALTQVGLHDLSCALLPLIHAL